MMLIFDIPNQIHGSSSSSSSNESSSSSSGFFYQHGSMCLAKFCINIIQIKNRHCSKLKKSSVRPH